MVRPDSRTFVRIVPIVRVNTPRGDRMTFGFRSPKRSRDMAKTRKEQFEAMVQDEPNDAELRYMLAMEYVSEGNDDAAVKCFSDIFVIAPDYPPAYHQAGRALQRLERYD